MKAWILGRRTLLAATCRKCKKLLPGSAFGYHLRNMRDKHEYIDRRCTDCKWGIKVKGRQIPL
jgi:RNase P subunit RPR2